VILGVGMTAAMVTVALQSGTAGDLVSCSVVEDVRLLASLFRPSTHGHLPGWAELQVPPMQVLVHGMLTQLWAPLVSVGGLYRRLRKVKLLALCMRPIGMPMSLLTTYSDGELPRRSSRYIRQVVSWVKSKAQVHHDAALP
jgi:hypothetical protein